MGRWSCIVYHPQSIKQSGRLRDILRQFRWNDIIALPGTRFRQNEAALPCSTQQIGQHKVYQWGWGNGKHVNDSCGVTLAIRQRVFSEKNVVNVFSPPKDLQGRGGALRLKRGDADLTPIVVYVPPEPASVRQQTASKAIWDWVHELLSQLPARTVNPVGGAAPEYCDDEAIGRSDAAVENYNGSLLHSCLLDHHMFAVNTFYDVGPTWYGWTGPHLCSRIGYVALPQSLRQAVVSCRILQGSGDALQNMARPGRCDHRPLQVVFDYKQAFGATRTKIQWDRDRMVQALSGNADSRSLAEAVEHLCQSDQYT